MTLCDSRQVDAALSMELDLTHLTRTETENVGEPCRVQSSLCLSILAPRAMRFPAKARPGDASGIAWFLLESLYLLALQLKSDQQNTGAFACINNWKIGSNAPKLKLPNVESEKSSAE